MGAKSARYSTAIEAEKRDMIQAEEEEQSAEKQPWLPSVPGQSGQQPIYSCHGTTFSYQPLRIHTQIRLRCLSISHKIASFGITG